jgi:diguanylate cyclase (GGDEF)-like protein
MSLGITARLVIAFAAVATLGVAANVVMERAIEVVQTTRVDRSQYSPLPDARSPISRPALIPANANSSASGQPPQAVSEPAIGRFVSAIDRFQSSMEVRASSDTAESTAGFDASAKELEAAASDFRRLLPRPALRAEVISALGAYRHAGADYLSATQLRRSAAGEYLEHLDHLDGTITGSIDSGWKIFGRVLARESLLTLHAKLDELRHRFGATGGPGTISFGSAEVAAGELSLRQAYAASERSLAKSQGAAWMRQTREDMERMARLREEVGAAAAQMLDAKGALASSRARLVALTSSARAAAVAAAADETSSNPRTGPNTNGALPPPVRSSPIVAAATTITTTTDRLPDRSRRLAVGTLTAAVLALLAVISIWTVRSILIPVRRMLDATRGLAQGEVATRVPRGGMKELDSLAAAFNRMASQLATARDITQDYRRHLESQVEQRTRQLQHLAERDSLTLLVNRRRFFVLLDQCMQRSREIECGVAVFFIDLDNFKNLNDGMGHTFGDRALISVAQRLEETAASFGFAARLGGDEFTVVHEEVFAPQDAEAAGLKLVDAFRRPLIVEGREITVSVSIGASLYPDHDQRAEGLLSAADAALFHAKALGRNQLAMFTPELLETATRKFTTEQGVRHALEHDEFELVYQPEVRMATLQVGLVEALVRWRMPDGRLASPDEFLAVTEESGLIVELGDWVLRNALRAASDWHRGGWAGVKVAINVSARQLIDHRFVQRIQELLRQCALPATCIELELTESVLQTGSSTIESLQLLRSLGIAIALDDFGTGYSSLASLEQLPLSRIKLDRSLIAGIDSNPRSRAIAFALIRLCDELGIEVTAEGVERESQFSRLAGSPAMYLQGYLISRPVTEAEVLGVNERMPQVMHDLMLSAPSSPARGPRSATQPSDQDPEERLQFTESAATR